MAQSTFSSLFSPLQIRHKTLKNRLNFGAHTANMAEGGLPGERHLGYYLERARGGTGMIVVEPVPVHRTGVLTRGNFLHESDEIIPHFRRITDACHEHDTVMIHQLYHVGQHGDWDNSYEPYWSASALPSYHDRDGSHAMNGREVEEMIDSFVNAAIRAQKSGFDGVELFAAYHAIIDQFWTPWSNRREDKWGGSFENRMRFSTEIINRTRQAVGEDFIIGVAVSIHDDIDVSLNIEQMQEVLAYHDERGLIDYMTCGTGNYFDFYPLIPTYPYAEKLGPPHAEALKSVAKHAKIQAESHIRTPENADYVIASGQADLVSLVRGQIADPHLANKAKEGRVEDIRPCLSCNQMCWGRRFRDYWISCLVNPSAGREFEWNGDTFTPAKKAKHVLVVGGGPAGLEAARVACEKGHRVTLAEASHQLGGQFRLAGMQPRRQQIIDLIDWYETQLTKFQADIRLNTYLDADDIREIGADEVIIAAGSLPAETGFQRWLPANEQLEGLENGNVHSDFDIMSRAVQPGDHVILVDEAAAYRGVGTAWHLAEKGHKVTIVTPYPMVGKDIERTSADGPIRAKLRQLGVEFKTECMVKSWSGHSAEVLDMLTKTTETIEADTLVFATTNISMSELGMEMQQDETDNIHEIGDCVAPRTAVMAIYEGRKLAMDL